MSERYSFSLTTFSPSGKLVQIEYALSAVAAGSAAVGIKAKDVVVIAAENKFKSPLYDEQYLHKVEEICSHIGMVYSGMGPDFRTLVKNARKIAQQYELMYGEPIPTVQLVQRVALCMQEFTQSGPYGISILIAGFDGGKPYLFQSDPSGAYFAWKATALGKNYINARAFLEKRYSSELEHDDAVHTALISLKESFDVKMTADNVEIGVCNKDGFHRLTKQQVLDHLGTL